MMNYVTPTPRRITLYAAALVVTVLAVSFAFRECVEC